MNAIRDIKRDRTKALDWLIDKIQAEGVPFMLICEKNFLTDGLLVNKLILMKKFHDRKIFPDSCFIMNPENFIFTKNGYLNQYFINDFQYRQLSGEKPRANDLIDRGLKTALYNHIFKLMSDKLSKSFKLKNNKEAQKLIAKLSEVSESYEGTISEFFNDKEMKFIMTTIKP